MKIRLVLPISGIVVEYNGLADLANHYADIAAEERRKSMVTETLRERRYHEGRGSAYDDIADSLRTMTVIHNAATES